MADLPNPHDALFRATFEEPQLAAAFFRDHLPNEIAAHLADKTPEKIDGSFVDEALASSQSDALFKVETRSGEPAYLYALLEHKSVPENALPLQLASYMVRIWRRFAKESGDAALRHLPPILPIVLYAGGTRRWNAPGGIREMIAGEPELAFLPGESYILRNIGEIPTEALSRNAALKAVFITMKREALKHLTEVIEALPPESELRRQIGAYIVQIYDGVDTNEFMTALRSEGAAEMEAHVATIVENLEKKAQLARAEGLAEGKAETLTRLLERRFGPLPRKARDRIAAAELEQIEAWFDAAIEAPDLEAVFPAGNRH